MGILTYMFTFYTQFSWARGAGNHSWSLYSSLTTLVSSLIRKKDSPDASLIKMPQMKWLALSILNMLFVSLFAANPVTHKASVIEYFKIVILYLLIIKVVDTKKKYKLFIWMQLWGNFYLGYRAKTVGRTIQGRLEGIGGPRTNTSNTLSSHILLFFPILGNLILLGNKWEKISGIVALPLIGNMFVQCNSRGAFLGAVASLIIALFMAHKKVRMKMIGGILICGIIGYAIAFERVASRLETVESYEEDASAMGRVEAWIGAIEMLQKYPLGTGGGGFKYYSPEYIPEVVAAHGGQRRSVHNTYLEIATNFGIQGLFLFMAMICHTLYELLQIRKRASLNGDVFYFTESTAIGIGLIGFLVSAIFGVRVYAENMYWYLALSTALSNIQKIELMEKENNLREKDDDPDNVH